MTASAGDRAVRRFHTAHRAVLHGNFRCSRMPHLYASLAQIALQRRLHVGRAVRHREDAIAAFGLQRTAVDFKKRLGVGRGEARERAIEEAWIRRRVFQHVLPRAVVRHVAAALSGDEQLFAEAVVRLEQRDRRAVLRGTARGHHPGRAAADDDDALIGRAHRRHIHPRCAPDFQRSASGAAPGSAQSRRRGR